MNTDRQPSTRKIAIFVSFSGEGGVERMVANLCQGFLDAGNQVDLLLIKDRGSARALVPQEVRCIKMGEHALTCLPRLVSYLRENTPAALLSSKHRANQIAILARYLSGVDTRLLVKVETNLCEALSRQNRVKKWLFARQLRLFYPHADGVIGVSEGVTECLKRLVKSSRIPFCTIYNPVLSDHFFEQARQGAGHPWFGGGEPPVVLAAGRLTRQKDFATLLRAFAEVVRRRNARLIILGEGSERRRLENLRSTLGLDEVVDLPGFVKNPFKYLAHANLFVLSSAWEGFGNVLVEAMALGVPVVSTDCPSGPREILAEGTLGPLVPVGDISALAEAIIAQLDAPVDRDVLVSATTPFTVEESSRAHLRLLFDEL